MATYSKRLLESHLDGPTYKPWSDTTVTRLSDLSVAGSSFERKRLTAKSLLHRREIFVGDVLNSSNSETLSVGFYRNKFKGERNEWVVTYDALICTRGAL